MHRTAIVRAAYVRRTAHALMLLLRLVVVVLVVMGTGLGSVLALVATAVVTAELLSRIRSTAATAS